MPCSVSTSRSSTNGQAAFLRLSGVVYQHSREIDYNFGDNVTTATDYIMGRLSSIEDANGTNCS